LDYDYSEQVGPPFNVANNTFQKLYSKFTIQVKSEVDEAQPPGTLEKLGIKSVREYVYQVSKCV
jgi:hypothetical protein